MMQVNLGKRKGVEDPNNVVVLKEVAGIQLELKYLSELAGEGEGEYWNKAEAVMRKLRETRQPKGLPTLFFGLGLFSTLSDWDVKLIFPSFLALKAGVH
jgi:hypothetical protein